MPFYLFHAYVDFEISAETPGEANLLAQEFVDDLADNDLVASARLSAALPEELGDNEE